MNLKRGIIQKILSNELSQNYLKELVFNLAISSGPDGPNRLMSHIIDIK